MMLLDFKDAVSTGGAVLTPGFNKFAIEMLINTLQCGLLLSEAESQRCKRAAMIKWKGSYGKNIEIDLFQENRNSEMKKLVKAMGANKTEKEIERASGRSYENNNSV